MAKPASIVYLMCNLSRIVLHSVLMTAYDGDFASLMMYALLIWEHSTHASEVFGLQQCCIRVIGGLGYWDCCWQCFPAFGALTLPCANIFQCLLYIRCHQQLFTQHSDIHDYPTRGNSNIIPGFISFGRARTCMNYDCIQFFNVLSLIVRNLDVGIFNRRIKKYLVSNALYTFDKYLTSDFSDLTWQHHFWALLRGPDGEVVFLWSVTCPECINCNWCFV